MDKTNWIVRSNTYWLVARFLPTVLVGFFNFLAFSKKWQPMIFRRRRPSMTCTPVPPSWLFMPKAGVSHFLRGIKHNGNFDRFPLGVSKNRGVSPKMDGEKNGKPYQNGWFGGTIIFGNIPLVKQQCIVWGLVKFHDPLCFFESATSTFLYSSETPWFSGQYYLSKTSLVPFTEAVSFVIFHWSMEVSDER